MVPLLEMGNLATDIMGLDEIENSIFNISILRFLIVWISKSGFQMRGQLEV